MRPPKHCRFCGYTIAPGEGMVVGYVGDRPSDVVTVWGGEGAPIETHAICAGDMRQGMRWMDWPLAKS